MPDEPVPQTFTPWRYETGTGRWRNVETGRYVGARSIEDITQGELSIRGTNIYRTDTQEVVGEVDAVRGGNLEIGSQGTVILNREIDPTTVNRQAAPGMQYRLQLAAEAISPLSGIIERTGGITSLTAFGHGLYYTQDPVTGAREYRAQMIARRSLTRVPVSVGEYQRVPPQEAIERGIIGFLAKNARAEVDRLAVSGLQLEDGSVTTNGSEIVKALARVLSARVLQTQILR